MAHLDGAVGGGVERLQGGTISPPAKVWIWNLLSVASATALAMTSAPPNSVSSDFGQLRCHAPLELRHRLRDGRGSNRRRGKADAGSLYKLTTLHPDLLPLVSKGGSPAAPKVNSYGGLPETMNERTHQIQSAPVDKSWKWRMRRAVGGIPVRHRASAGRCAGQPVCRGTPSNQPLRKARNSRLPARSPVPHASACHYFSLPAAISMRETTASKAAVIDRRPLGRIHGGESLLELGHSVAQVAHGLGIFGFEARRRRLRSSGPPARRSRARCGSRPHARCGPSRSRLRILPPPFLPPRPPPSARSAASPAAALLQSASAAASACCTFSSAFGYCRMLRARTVRASALSAPSNGGVL